MSRPLLTHLPVQNRFHRVDQHDYIEDKTVPNPDDEQNLCECEQVDRTPDAQIPRYSEPDATDRNVGERVDNGIPFITERDRYFPVSVDDESGIFVDLPQRFGGDRR